MTRWKTLIPPVLTLWLHVSFSCVAQPDSTATALAGTSLSGISILTGLTLASGAAVHFVRYEPLRSSHHSTFHVREDYTYAYNQDKLLHFYGGVVASSVWTEGFLACGVDEAKAALYGSATSFAFLTFMKIEDGYVDYLGFDRADELGNLLGSVYPLVQYHVPILNSFTPKAGYRASSNEVVSAGQRLPGFLEDHEGQKFWIGITVHDLLPKVLQTYWPSPLGVAVGRSVQRLQSGNPSGGLYLALDVDLRKLPGESPLLKKLWKFLNYIHLPMPAVRLSPSVIWYGVCF